MKGKLQNFLMKNIFLVVIALLAVACDRGPDNPLPGRWQSDEKATLAEARDSGTVTEEQLQELKAGKVFGKLIAVIDDEEIVFDYEGNRSHSPYTILKVEASFVVIKLYNSATKAYETTRIEVRGDRMWVPSAMAGFREVFVRLD